MQVLKAMWQSGRVSPETRPFSFPSPAPSGGVGEWVFGGMRPC
ncbi:MAG: hypothetical protein OT477_10120 [Chloroflexi bacterium]|nr:hypothetical protein [Chloroflexota bacterium]